MEMTVNQLEVFITELQKNGVVISPCTVCGGLEINVSKLFKMFEYNPGGKVFGGSLLVVAPVICMKCGHVRFFNAKTIQDNLIENVASGNDDIT
jgi:hypothetical protein